MQYDVELVQKIETLLGHQLEKHELKEKDVLKSITRVYKARRVASMRMTEDEARMESRGKVPIRKRKKKATAEA